jgi:hypothetical protein
MRKPDGLFSKDAAHVWLRPFVLANLIVIGTRAAALLTPQIPLKETLLDSIALGCYSAMFMVIIRRYRKLRNIEISRATKVILLLLFVVGGAGIVSRVWIERLERTRNEDAERIQPGTRTETVTNSDTV